MRIREVRQLPEGRAAEGHLLLLLSYPSCPHPVPHLRGPGRPPLHQARQRRGNIKHIPVVDIWVSGCQAQSACGHRDHRSRDHASAALGELTACWFGSAGSIWPAPWSILLISKVWELCPGGWHPLAGQACGVQLWHSGSLG